MTAPVTVAIEAMGAQGHGIARIDGGKIFIPCTLPGETVRVELHGQKAVATKIETPSPEPHRTSLQTFRHLRRVRAAALGRARL